MRLLFATALAALSIAVSASPASAQFRVNGKRNYDRLQDAVYAIGAGSGTIQIAPGRYRQCAVQERGQIVYFAERPGTVIFDGTPCEDKAALVLRGRGARVVGVTFENMSVPDGNGAGIRQEQGYLHVAQSVFRNSQTGILSATDPASEIRIERSVFSGLGGCRSSGGCSHSLYIGLYGKLTVLRSRFEKGRGGHYLKTRSRAVEITDNQFDDTSGSATNYMIDLSVGSSGTIARNNFVQGRNKENYSALIAVAPEGRDNESNLTIVNNRAALAPGARRTIFVADHSRGRLNVEGNVLGAGIARFERRWW
jgi:hypothetical protein